MGERKREYPSAYHDRGIPIENAMSLEALYRDKIKGGLNFFYNFES